MKLYKSIGVLLIVLSMLLPVKAVAEQPENPVWYIWGDQMATEPEANGYDFKKASDPEEFRPTITAYLVDEQSCARGNVIVLSGGADRRRNNKGEGIPACEYLKSIGYLD